MYDIMDCYGNLGRFFAGIDYCHMCHAFYCCEDSMIMRRICGVSI